jgi:hypothetical protein
MVLKSSSFAVLGRAISCLLDECCVVVGDRNIEVEVRVQMRGPERTMSQQASVFSDRTLCTREEMKTSQEVTRLPEIHITQQSKILHLQALQPLVQPQNSTSIAYIQQSPRPV